MYEGTLLAPLAFTACGVWSIHNDLGPSQISRFK